MKYIAKPVEVEAHEIVDVGGMLPDGSRHVALSNGDNATATVEMMSRYVPVPGDYWVIQSDGYTYLNPKEVFERKYQNQGA